MTSPHHDHEHDDHEHANVVPLPVRHAEATRLDTADEKAAGVGVVEPDTAVSGEVLTPAREAELARDRVGDGSEKARPTVKRLAAEGARLALRSGYRVYRGHEQWAARAVRAATYAHYREQVLAARAAGDAAGVAEWLDRLRQAKADRRDRIAGAPRALMMLVLSVLVAVIVLLGVLLVVGVSVHLWDGGWTWGEWWSFVAGTGEVLGVLVMLAVQAAVIGAPVAWLLAAHRAGAGVADAPAWALSSTEREESHRIVTPAGIGEALAHLPIPDLRREIKAGWTVQFSTPPVRVNNRGYQAVFSLPMGVTPEMIADKREVLARNLFRDATEVWPAKSDKAGYVDLWVADPGLATRPAPPWPLMDKGTVDVFDGVPFGVAQRGDVIAPPLVAVNLFFGGMMGQGKSNAARVVMLGAALDPLAELMVFVFAGNGDFDAYAPRLARYHKGVKPETFDAAVATLQELYDEMERREDRLAELGAKKVSRGLAEKHPELRPKVALFSECHELFGGDRREEATELAVGILKRARKTGITLLFDTQSSRADAVPPAIVELVQINACFHVKSWRSNDGFLGDGSFQAGIRATELRPGKDRGTSILTGATDERFEILKWFYIPVDDDAGWDAATEVIERAMRAVNPAVVTGNPPTAAPVRRDLLEDLAEALGHDTVPAADVPALLAKLAPDWTPYRKLTGKQVRELLAAEGVKVPSTGNRYPVDPVTVREALAKRATRDLDGQD